MWERAWPKRRDSILSSVGSSHLGKDRGWSGLSILKAWPSLQLTSLRPNCECASCTFLYFRKFDRDVILAQES